MEPSAFSTRVGGHPDDSLLYATFLGSCGDLFVGICLPKDASQPTNIVNSFTNSGWALN